MKYLLPLLLVCAAGVEEILAQGRSSALSAFGLNMMRRRGPRRRPRVMQKCNLRKDKYNPFYWHGHENICSDEICKANPLLHCNITREYLMDQVVAHYPEDIFAEVKAIEEYFHTFFPKPRNILPYRCQGVCEMGDRKHPRDPQEITRVFADIEQQVDYTSKYIKKRLLCHIIGPKIFAHQCGGPCRLPYSFGNQGNLHCVASSQVTVDAWAFCPGSTPSCRKIPVTVPLSCTCQKLKCLKKLPVFKPFAPRLPDLTDVSLDPFAPPPADVFGQGAGGDSFGQGLGPDIFGPDFFGPDVGPDAFGQGQVPFGPNLPGQDNTPFGSGTSGGSDPFGDLPPLGPAITANLGNLGELGGIDPSLIGMATGPSLANLDNLGAVDPSLLGVATGPSDPNVIGPSISLDNIPGHRPNRRRGGGGGGGRRGGSGGGRRGGGGGRRGGGGGIETLGPFPLDGALGQGPGAASSQSRGDVHIH